MTDQEINEIIAEKLFGWIYYIRDFEREKYPDYKGILQPRSPANVIHSSLIVDLPNYCSDHNAIAEARAKIDRKVLQVEFIKELFKLPNGYLLSANPMMWYFGILQATPRHQAEAIVKTLENMK